MSSRNSRWSKRRGRAAVAKPKSVTTAVFVAAGQAAIRRAGGMCDNCGREIPPDEGFLGWKEVGDGPHDMVCYGLYCSDACGEEASKALFD